MPAEKRAWKTDDLELEELISIELFFLSVKMGLLSVKAHFLSFKEYSHSENPRKINL